MMTTPNSPEQKLIEALEEMSEYKGEGPPSTPYREIVKLLGSNAREILPIARSLLAELAEAREKAEALEWLINQFGQPYKKYLLGREVCPVIVKQMIEQKNG